MVFLIKSPSAPIASFQPITGQGHAIVTANYEFVPVVQTTPANVNDGTKAIDLLDAMPRIPGKRGRPRQKPDVALGDRAYGTAANIAASRERGILPLLATPRSENGSGLGTMRYVIERTMSWFGNFRRLKMCYEKTGEHLQALHELAASLICAKKLGWA